jgi:hypothetical protein
MDVDCACRLRKVKMAQRKLHDSANTLVDMAKVLIDCYFYNILVFDRKNRLFRTKDNFNRRKCVSSELVGEYLS